MAETGLKALQAALEADEELLAKYQAAARQLVEANEAKAEAVQKAAAQLGFELALEEIEQAMAEEQSLDDVELEAIAGGEGDLPFRPCMPLSNMF